MLENNANVTLLPVTSKPPVPFLSDSYDESRIHCVPLLIDNGSNNFRFGFATSSAPHSNTNLVARYRERKLNKQLLLFGDGIDSESSARGQAKSPWEGDALLNFDALEHGFDYAFIRLGIDTPSVKHPVLMTERMSTPLHSRTLTSELLFEQYSVPSLAFCVDSVMSFYQNNLPPASEPFNQDALVLSFNTASSSVIPIVQGKGIMSHAKRIPWGGLQASEYLLRLLQLKYATFPARLTNVHSTWMLHTFGEFANDYTALLRSLKNPSNLRQSGRIVQFPFTVTVQEEKTEEELNRIAEKRKEQGRKLQELAAKSRVERMSQKESDLQYLINLRERKEHSSQDWVETLREEGFDDEPSLNETIKKLENVLKKNRKKDGEVDDAVDETLFSLVDVPDAELDEEGLKEKRKQKLMKAGYEARTRAKKEKDKERDEKEAEERQEEDDRGENFAGWVEKTRKDQENLIAKIRNRAKRRAALGDRKSAAAQARMKSIATLAADDRVPKKKRKVGGEDMFGADDGDWAIYKKINNTGVSSDEEEDLTQLQVIEQKLLTYDPKFTTQHTLAAISTQRSALVSAFRPQYEEGDIEGNTRIHLNVERWRVCEVWFQPSMAGVDSAGLGEVMQNILARFSDEVKGRMVQNVFLTGGPSQFPGLSDRVFASLRPILPPEMPITIKRAADVSLDAWNGMASFARTRPEELQRISVTRAEYDEHGGERVKRWWGGNWNASVP